MTAHTGLTRPLGETPPPPLGPLPDATQNCDRAPAGVRFAAWLALAITAMGALYLGMARGEALLVDLSALGRAMWCF